MKESRTKRTKTERKEKKRKEAKTRTTDEPTCLKRKQSLAPSPSQEEEATLSRIGHAGAAAAKE